MEMAARNTMPEISKKEHPPLTPPYRRWRLHGGIEFNFRIVCHLGLCYALFKLILGAHERSLWITSFGVYYLIVSIIRFNIIMISG